MGGDVSADALPFAAAGLLLLLSLLVPSISEAAMQLIEVGAHPTPPSHLYCRAEGNKRRKLRQTCKR